MMKRYLGVWLMLSLCLLLLVYFICRSAIVHEVPRDEHRPQKYRLPVLQRLANVSFRAESAGITQENWSPPKTPAPKYIQNLDQTDPALSEYIARYWLLPPSTLPLVLRQPNRVHYSQGKHSAIVDKILDRRENGFFIECGAYDGETFSNSLFFEKYRNWSGVLIEADNTFEQMRKKHRHSYLVNACLSPVERASVIQFRLAGVIGGLSKYMTAGHISRINKDQTAVNKTDLLQCFPMFSILQAIGVTHVDFFSLDIESAEAEVVESLPLDKMTVDVFMIEHNGEKDKLRRIKATLVDEYGYIIAQQDAQDITLKRKDLFL